MIHIVSPLDRFVSAGDLFGVRVPPVRGPPGDIWRTLLSGGGGGGGARDVQYFQVVDVQPALKAAAAAGGGFPLRVDPEGTEVVLQVRPKCEGRCGMTDIHDAH